MPSSCDISNDDELVFPLNEDQVKTLVDAVLAHEGVERECYVSVSIVSDEDIAETNAEWRGVEAPTDVVSLECERPDDSDLADGEPCELGDIVLAPAYIEAQASRFGTTFADECRLLLVHGVLHLLGHDHLDDESAEAMEALEDQILSSAENDGTLGHVVITRHRTEEEP
ncbi:rRNA maturation RNase YbeY [Paratractidigestivibacter sp.]|uniref:rRNA maturation RNase YbeY n=1 Tax=Paratractidigestivibacter sp. TaxID=2847316 RepID=UPI002AC99AEE|nr:rRNA maturation RNase YbeY [Paratractidigestivibacter sp.]